MGVNQSGYYQNVPILISLETKKKIFIFGINIQYYNYIGTDDNL